MNLKLVTLDRSLLPHVSDISDRIYISNHPQNNEPVIQEIYLKMQLLSNGSEFSNAKPGIVDL
jgi:hypothetical protein